MRGLWHETFLEKDLVIYIAAALEDGSYIDIKFFLRVYNVYLPL